MRGAIYAPFDSIVFVPVAFAAVRSTQQNKILDLTALKQQKRTLADLVGILRWPTPRLNKKLVDP